MTDTIPATATGLPNRRRAFLRHLASVPLVGGAVVIADRADAASTSPDAELIALGAELRTAWDAEREAEARYEGDATVERVAMMNALADASYDIAVKIEGIRATTLEGLKVKALAISWTHGGKEIDDTTLNEEGTTDVCLAASIIRDLLATGA